MPVVRLAKPGCLLVVAVLLSACGGGAKPAQVVKGDGFSFSAPGGWDVNRTGAATVATHGSTDLVETRIFQTVKTYEPKLFKRLPRELDGVVASVAKDLGGTAGAPKSVTAGGSPSWAYAITYGDKVEEITFVFRDRHEYQLLCRRAAGGSDAACTQLVQSFALT
jgi:hypothetical protein